MARHVGIRHGYIYALIDTRTAETRYIGQTLHVHARLDGHYDGAKNPKSHCHLWLAGLLAAGYEPLMIVVEDGDWTARQLNDAERRWIKRYDNLTNMTPGGEGGGVKGRLYGSHDRKLSGFGDPERWKRGFETRSSRTPEQKRESALKSLETRRSR